MDVPAAPTRRDVTALAALLLLCVGGGALIGVAFAGQSSTYQLFDLPPWAPPSWLFGPAWTLLYTLMAISAWLVWRTQDRYRTRALTAFGVQLVLNFLWTPAFFGADNPMLGLVVIVGVLLAVGWWTFEAWRVQRRAGALQLPYLAWVGYATALNTAIAF
jgi:tryptophan-rich sensory protein